MIHNGKKTRKISIRFKLMIPVTAIMLIMALVLGIMGNRAVLNGMSQLGGAGGRDGGKGSSKCC